ncbi:MAG: hypothetical protein ACR2PS_11580 [Pseudomonadales bacterium]
MAKRRKPLAANEPLRHADHRRPRTRREFISQGFMAGAGTVMGSSIFSLFANPRAAYALSPDLTTAVADCGIATQGAGKIPFICFDLAGGVNISGSNVLVGGQGGQMDFLSTAGYSKLGIPGDMVPGLAEATPTTTSNGDHTDTSLGLAFHSDSAFLRGILEKAPTAVGSGNVNGAVIPARSDNDTGNNPHNPMYGIAKAGLAGAGADGSLVTLVGSRNSDSGGNSMAPAMMIDPAIRPTKIDRPSDVTGLVDVGDFGALSQAEAVAVMESVYRISDDKLGNVDTKMTNNLELLKQVRCGYVKSADLAERFGDPSQINPDDRLAASPRIVSDAGGIFSTTEFDGDSEFRKTASVMKMVVDGFAGAGTITMGGYDYHTGERATGEVRDLRAGRCMGACLEYAARVGVPLMLYVCSDGSVASNGREDNSADGRGKGEWTGDNSSTAASFFLVYNPGSQPVLIGATPEEQAVHQQIGYMRSDASVETAATPAANNVNLLVETVILNYMALHGEQAEFANIFPTALGGLVDSLTAFEPIVNGTIT